MDVRAQALRDWADAVLALDEAAPGWQVVAGDASSRRYFRLSSNQNSWICVDAPPATEKNPEFLQVRGILAEAGILVPELLGVSPEQGFLLLGDLGEQLLLPLLSAETVSAHYAEALDILYSIQCIELENSDLPAYSAAVLREELQRFPQWFCSKLLGVDANGNCGEMFAQN